MKTGIELIADERKRQVEKEGWTNSHDDEYQDTGDLALAAACYALPHDKRHQIAVGDTVAPIHWPWAVKWWKPSPHYRIKELTKAGALIAAEIDRLQRIDR